MSDQTRTDISEFADEAEASFPGVVGLYADEGTPLATARVVLSTCRVGRAPEMELSIHDSRLSREHAEIKRAGAGFHVRDLGSHNGTFVDGRSAAGQGLKAVPGSVVRVARSLLLLVRNVQPFVPNWIEQALNHELVGGPALNEARRRIELFAPERNSLLIQGETGSGKERVAAAIHRRSGRAGQMIAVNCAAIPKDLVESELFGHVRGAFSGANQTREGLFRQAHGGTLMLDELGELPLEVQAKLLRVLEERCVRPVGDDRALPVDVRVIAATNRDLDAQVESGAFRADLLHRLAAVRITLPPLRERREDIPVLIQHFLGATPLEFSTSAMEMLVCSSWPGNARQLRNTVEAAAVSARARGTTRVQREDLDGVPQGAPQPTALDGKDLELRSRVETALRIRDGNVSQVGRDLGLHRARLYELFERLGVDPSAYRKS